MARQAKLPPGLWRRGGTYYARFTQDGRVVRKRLSTDLAAAKVLLNELRSRADKAAFGIIDNNYPWVDAKAAFLDWARQSVRHPGDYERDLGRFEQYCKVQSIAQVDQAYVVGYRNWRLGQTKGAVAGKEWAGAEGRAVSPRTVNREVNTLTNMLNRLVEWKRIKENPLANLAPLHDVQPRKERRALTLAEVERLFEKSPPKLRLIWRLFMTTGIRRRELVELRFADIDPERRSLTIRKAVAKSKREREIPLDDETLAAILALADEEREPVEGETPPGRFSREHVFVTRLGTPYRNNLLREFYAACSRAGIEGAHAGGDVDIHSLRVSFATLAIDAGANVKAVQNILGHSTLALTMKVYAKATDQSKRDTINALPFASASPPEGVIPVQNKHATRTTAERPASEPRKQVG